MAVGIPMGVAMAGIDQAAPAGAPDATTGGVQAFHFSTDNYRAHERVMAWREVFGRTLLKIDVAPRSREGFHAQARILRAPGLGVIRARTSAVDLSNSLGLISNDDVSFGCVFATRWRASQLGRITDVRAGDGVLLSNSDLGALALPEACRFVTVGLPRSVLEALVPELGDFFARGIPASNPALQMLMHYLELMEEDTITGERDLMSAFGTHVCDLLALALGATRDTAEQARMRGLSAARLRAIKADIRRACGRPDLSVGAIAARYGVSARHVQRSFEELGLTFTQYLTEQRLAAAYKVLCRPGSTKVAISTIAYDSGFSDVSHFNRLFRRRFGCTPGDVRKAVRSTGA